MAIRGNWRKWEAARGINNDINSTDVQPDRNTSANKRRKANYEYIKDAEENQTKLLDFIRLSLHICISKLEAKDKVVNIISCDFY